KIGRCQRGKKRPRPRKTLEVKRCVETGCQSICVRPGTAGSCDPLWLCGDQNRQRHGADRSRAAGCVVRSGSENGPLMGITNKLGMWAEETIKAGTKLYF